MSHAHVMDVDGVKDISSWIGNGHRKEAWCRELYIATAQCINS